MIADNAQYVRLWGSCYHAQEECIRSKVTSTRAQSARGRVAVNHIIMSLLDMIELHIVYCGFCHTAAWLLWSLLGNRCVILGNRLVLLLFSACWLNIVVDPSRSCDTRRCFGSITHDGWHHSE